MQLVPRDGFSQHGDYMFGWKGDSLQRALNKRCNFGICGELETQSSEEAMKCTKLQTVSEDVDTCMPHLSSNIDF